MTSFNGFPGHAESGERWDISQGEIGGMGLYCFVPNPALIPPLLCHTYTGAMTFSLAPFAFALLQALGIYARVMGRDGLIQRPGFVNKAIAARLRVGVRALEAFLRRVLILMALEIEPDLIYVARPENLARAKARMATMRPHTLVIFPNLAPSGGLDFGHWNGADSTSNVVPLDLHSHAAVRHQVTVPIGHWLDRLDHLHALAKDPIAKARRLAFSLARSRHGILMAPTTHPRLLRRWGTAASAIHDAMAFQIMQKSRYRPPSFPPPWRGRKPTITRL